MIRWMMIYSFRLIETVNLTSDTLVLPQAVAAGIKMHAFEQYPIECCGLLGGFVDTEVVMSASMAARATSNSFNVNLSQFRKVGQDILQSGFRIIGMYHSHPDGCACISERDKIGMTFSGVSLILSVKPRLKMLAYYVEGNYVRSLKIVTK